MELFQKTKQKTDFTKLNKLVYGLPKSGKCLGLGTKVMMADCSLRNVEDIKTNDFVMGPGGVAKKVVGTNRGKGKLFLVKQNKGINYIVNSEHILALRKSGTDSMVTIKVSDYVSDQTSLRYKGVKAPVDFPFSEVPIDPHWLGLWLGDGHSANTGISNPEKEVVDYIYDHAKKNQLKVTVQSEDRCPSYFTVNERGSGNHVLKFMQDMNLINNKHIPSVYLKNSVAVRMKVLAGLIDSDGFNQKKGGIEILSKHQSLANDILFLARSLGFRSTSRVKRSSIASTDFEGDYHRIGIYGDFNRVPLLLERKRPDHQGIRNPLNTGIDILPIGEGQYAGFELEGDGLFLLEDFTITHNSTLASHFYDEAGKPPAFIMTEDGAGVLELNAERVTSWESFKKLRRNLTKNKAEFEKHFSSIVVDLITELDQWCTEYVCDQKSITALADLDFGKGFALKKQEFLPEIRKLMDIAPCTFIAHTQEKEIKDNGEKYKTQMPSLEKASLEYINGKMDAIMWIAQADKKGYSQLVIKPSQTCVAGSRFPQLVGSWKIDPADVNATYKELRNKFSNGGEK